MASTSSPRSTRNIGTSRVLGLLGGGSVLAATAGASGLGALLLAASPAGAASFTVTNLNDSGAGSLRQAILDANAAPTDDVIDFAPGLSGTILLTSGQMMISDEVTITGSGSANVTISGGGTNRIFYIFDSPHVGALAVTISGLTLTDGYAAKYGGGAIVAWSAETTLRDVVITNSSAQGKGGAILQALSGNSQGRDARLTLENCVISGNSATGNGGGVALYNTGGAIITDTVFTGNTAAYGGGAISDEFTTVSTTITHSRMSGNSSYLGGALLVSYQDAAGSLLLDGVSMVNNTSVGAFGAVTISQSIGSKQILSSTIADNVGSGIYAGSSTSLRIAHSTISGNSGGGIVGVSQDFVIDSSLLADNVGGDLAFQVGSGSTATVNWSLVESPGSFITAGSNNITGVDPALQPLLDYSNTAWVRPILNTSSAFNAGNPAFVAPPSTDQTGQARVAYGRIDMGAYELQEPAEPVVPAFTG